MNTKKNRKVDIVLGDKDILNDDDFLEKNIRQRISILLPKKVIKNLKEEALNKGIGHQTLINQILLSYINKF